MGTFTGVTGVYLLSWPRKSERIKVPEETMRIGCFLDLKSIVGSFTVSDTKEMEPSMRQLSSPLTQGFCLNLSKLRGDEKVGRRRQSVCCSQVPMKHQH